MHRLAQVVLLLIHALYGFKNFLFSLLPLRNPKPLLARRRKLPAHLAVLLVPDAENHDTRQEERVMEECVEQVVEWCKDLGVKTLSVYDRDGVLSRKAIYASPRHSQGLLDVPEKKTSGDPLTPPSSDTDSSRPWSPEPPIHRSSVTTFHLPYISRDITAGEEKGLLRRRRHSQIFESKARLHKLTVHLLSRQSSKPTLAAAARSLALRYESRESDDPISLSIEALGELLEGESGFPPPDLIIVHSLYPSTAPLELHGFPPWQIRLSEMYYAPRRGGVLRDLLQYLTPSRRRRKLLAPSAISEIEFRRALDDYSGVEMRLGK